MKWYICYDNTGKELWRIRGAKKASELAGIHETNIRKHVCYGTRDRKNRTYDVDTEPWVS
jgi:hypothetical protein